MKKPTPMGNQINFTQEAIRLIKLKMDEKRVNQVALAKSLNMEPSSVSRMLKSNSLSIEKLKQLSICLDYNFFVSFAGMLDLKEPALHVEPPPPDHTICNERIRELEIENNIMLKILKAGD